MSFFDTVSRLTLGEVAKVEKLSGLAIDQIAEEGTPKALAMAAMAYVATRRTNPAFTWDDAQNLTFEDFETLVGSLDPDDGEAGDAAGNEPTPAD